MSTREKVHKMSSHETVTQHLYIRLGGSLLLLHTMDISKLLVFISLSMLLCY